MFSNIKRTLNRCKTRTKLLVNIVVHGNCRAPILTLSTAGCRVLYVSHLVRPVRGRVILSGILRVISYIIPFEILPTDTPPEVEAAVVGLEEPEEPESGKKGFNEIRCY